MTRIRSVGGAKRWSPMSGKVTSAAPQATSMDRYTLVHCIASARRTVQAEFDVGSGLDIVHHGETVGPRHSQKAVGGDGVSKLCYSETEMKMTRQRLADEIRHNKTKRESDPPMERMTEHGTQYIFDDQRSQYRERFLRAFPGLDALAEACACLYGCDNTIRAVASVSDRENWYRKLGLGVDHQSLRDTSERLVAQLASAEGAQKRVHDNEIVSLSEINKELVELGGVAGLSETELELLGTVEAPTATSDWEASLDEADSNLTTSVNDSSAVEPQYAVIHDAFEKYSRGKPIASLMPTDLTHIHEAQELSKKVRWRELLECLVREEFHLLRRNTDVIEKGANGSSDQKETDLVVMKDLDDILRTKKLFEATPFRATAVAPHLVARASSATMENLQRDASAHDRLSE